MPPGQIVLSGDKAALDRAIEIAKARGAKRCILLPVSAPFHCSLLAPAADIMAEALANITILPPAVPVVANVTAEPVADPAAIRALLVQQVTSPVRWREGVLAMRAAGVEGLVEIGAGKVLSGLARRIDRELGALSIETPDEIEAFLKAL